METPAGNGVSYHQFAGEGIYTGKPDSDHVGWADCIDLAGGGSYLHCNRWWLNSAMGLITTPMANGQSISTTGPMIPAVIGVGYLLFGILAMAPPVTCGVPTHQYLPGRDIHGDA